VTGTNSDRSADMNDLDDVADRLTDWPEDETITLGDVLERAGTRAYGPLVLVIGLFGLGPTGAVPGATLVTGSLLLLLALQMVFGRDHPWLPSRLLRLSFDSDVIVNHRNRIRDGARRLGKLVVPGRLQALAGTTGGRFAAICLVPLAIIAYPLAVVPFGAAIPMSVCVLFGLALTADDGVWMLIAGGATLLSLGASAALLL